MSNSGKGFVSSEYNSLDFVKDNKTDFFRDGATPSDVLRQQLETKIAQSKSSAETKAIEANGKIKAALNNFMK